AYQQTRHDADRDGEEDRDHGIAGWTQDGVYSQQFAESAPDRQQMFLEPHHDRDGDQHGHDENEAGDDEVAQTPEYRFHRVHDEASHSRNTTAGSVGLSKRRSMALGVAPTPARAPFATRDDARIVVG